MPNVFHPEWNEERRTGEFATTPGTEADAVVKVARISQQVNAQKLGSSLYELQPGAAQSPLHAHHANEEMLIVLSGRPTLRTLDGARELHEGEVVTCPAGRRGAHRLENHDDGPARVLMICTAVFPDVIEHVDEDRVIVMTASPFPTNPGDEDALMLAFSRQDGDAPGSRPIR